MGILKKSGSWRTNKHNRRITFGAEEYSTGETPQKVKLHDGMSDKNRAWFNFIDLVITLRIRPQIAWERVPEKYLEFVWRTVLDCLDKYAVNGSFIQMPMGNRSGCKIINEYYEEDVVFLGEWVYEMINKKPYRTKDLVKKKKVCKKCNIGNVEYDKHFGKDMCYICDFDWNGGEEDENDENWDNIKQKCCSSPISVIPEYPNVIKLNSVMGEIEI